MINFKSFIAEAKHPMWVKVTTAGLVLKIRSLSRRISSEQDPQKQNLMIAQQAKLVSYMGGLGIAVSTEDPKLIGRMKNLSKRD